MMKKLVVLLALGMVIELEAIENQYFSLEQRAQEWLKNEKTQKCINNIQYREFIIGSLDLLEKVDGIFVCVIVDFEPVIKSIDDLELRDVLYNLTNDIILENAYWAAAHVLGYDTDLEVIEYLEEGKYYTAEEAIYEKVKAVYPSKEEFKKKESQLRDEGVVEAMHYVIKLLKSL